jgi:hypothetical protein
MAGRQGDERAVFRPVSSLFVCCLTSSPGGSWLRGGSSAVFVPFRPVAPSAGAMTLKVTLDASMSARSAYAFHGQSG